MREHFVLHYRGVLVDEYGFDGEGRDFGKQYSSEGICDACVEPD